MKTSATILESNSMHSALATAGRSHEIPEALDAYGWLIGSWELELVGYDDEGNVMHTTGEAHLHECWKAALCRTYLSIRPDQIADRILRNSRIGTAQQFAFMTRPSRPGE
jgi:hypothetical protein